VNRRVFLPGYLYGTLAQGSFDLRSMCSGRATEFALTSTPTTVALTALTLGIYTPRVLELECAAPDPGRAGAR
jgi:hypothetical protein